MSSAAFGCRVSKAEDRGPSNATGWMYEGWAQSGGNYVRRGAVAVAVSGSVAVAVAAAVPGRSGNGVCAGGQAGRV